MLIFTRLIKQHFRYTAIDTLMKTGVRSNKHKTSWFLMNTTDLLVLEVHRI